MKIGLLGTGAYGMALTSILLENNHKVTMWTKFESEKEELNRNRGNESKLPGYRIPDNVIITCNIEEAVKDKDLIIIAVPAAFVDSACKEMKPFVKEEHIVIATKGIEQETGLFINQILEKHLNTRNVAVISGPSFAVDIITKMPIGLSVASRNPETILLAKQTLQNEYVKLRATDDIIGVEVCGSIKNVIAIASGMLEGLNANDSTKAMLITEAMHDMEEILMSFDCNKRTVMSYAGLGDLLLTCTSVKSRNYRFGKILGQKSSKQEIDEYLKNNTVEGYYTLESIYQLLKDKKVSIPIIDLIYEVAVRRKNPELLLIFLIEKS